VVFHKRRHPRELGAAEVEQFLTHLAVDRKVVRPRRTRHCRRYRISCRHVLEIELSWLDNVTRTRRSRLPVVLSREVNAPRSRGTYPGRKPALRQRAAPRWRLRLRVKDLALGGNSWCEAVARIASPWCPRRFRRACTCRNSGRGSRRSGAEKTSRVSCPMRWHGSQAATQWARTCSRPQRSAATHQAPPCVTTCTKTVQRRCRVRCARPASAAGELPYAASLLRHPPAGGRLRHPHVAGAARPRRS
jgi:hypothetical protein